MSEAVLVGIDIGGTKSAAVVGNPDGRILAREEIATTPESPEDTLRPLIERAHRLAAGASIAAIGVSCAGPLSSRDGLVLSPPNLPGWDRVPIVRIIREALGAPTALENDANAAALAEWDWGLRRGVDNLIYLTCGTGQGAGLILDGRLYRGRQDLAGEVGHVRLLPTGPVGYHKAGSVEGLTAGPALGALAKLRLEAPHAASTLDGTPRERITGKIVGEAAVAGDALAQEVVRESGEHLGATCAMLIDLLNPQRISLGSMANRLGPLLLDAVRAAAQREALPLAYEACVIEPAELGARVQDLAALAVARLAAQ